MHADIHWIRELVPMRLAVMPRPRAGEWLSDELAQWQQQGVSQVICLLENSELRDLGLLAERAECEALGITFNRFPIPDRTVPTASGTFGTLIEQMCVDLRAGIGIAIHCRAGIGRTGLLAASVLVSSGWSAADAFDAVTRARGLRVPDTDAQREWVFRYARQRRDSVAD